MKTIEHKFDCPEFLVCPLEYGDIDGLEYDDEHYYRNAIDELENLKRHYNATHYTLQYGEDRYFTYAPSFCSLGSTCVELTVTFFIGR